MEGLIIGIGTFIVVAIIILVIFKILKSLLLFRFVFKIISLAFLLIMVFLVIGAIVIIRDVNDFRNNFQNSTNLIILKDNSTFLSGIILRVQDNTYKPLATKELSNLEKLYQKNPDNLALNTQYYKIIIIDIDIYESLGQQLVNNKNINLTGAEMKRILLSTDAKAELSNVIAKKQGVKVADVLSEIGSTNDEIKPYLLSHAISYFFNPAHLDRLAEAFKNDQIAVYKDTPLFQMIKFIPAAITRSVISRNMTGNTTVS